MLNPTRPGMFPSPTTKLTEENYDFQDLLLASLGLVVAWSRWQVSSEMDM